MNSGNKKKTKGDLSRMHLRMVLVAAVLAIYLIFCHVLHFGPGTPEDSWGIFCMPGALAIPLAYCALLCELCLISGDFLDKKAYFKTRAVFRAGGQFLILLAGNLVLIVFCHCALYFFYAGNPLAGSDSIALMPSAFPAAALSFLLSMSDTGRFLLKGWQNDLQADAERKIRQANCRESAAGAELELLQLLLDGHFVSCNINALAKLLEKDPGKAALFLENLTKVYRYIAANSKRDSVTVRQEIDFLRAYLSVMERSQKKRINLKTDLDAAVLDLSLPPVTLLLLVQYAVADQRISADRPLDVLIQSGQHDLLVRNSLRISEAASFESSDPVRRNIERRYEILKSGSPLFYKCFDSYLVRVPLVGN